MGRQEPAPGWTLDQAGLGVGRILEQTEHGARLDSKRTGPERTEPRKTGIPDGLDQAPGRIPENRTPEEQESGPCWVQGDQDLRSDRTPDQARNTGTGQIPPEDKWRPDPWIGHWGEGQY